VAGVGWTGFNEIKVVIYPFVVFLTILKAVKVSN